MTEAVFWVSGMRCASCEVLIEKKILELPKVKFAEATAAKSRVVIECQEDCPTLAELNQLFKENGYVFSKWAEDQKIQSQGLELFLSISIALLMMVIFWGLNSSGLASLINVTSKSSWPVFFGFGLMAGISSCAALVGGLVLSLSKQWLLSYSDKDLFWVRFRPHFLFNLGRIVSFAIFGFVLGMIGSKFQLSPIFSFFMIAIVSLLMIVLGLQMMGIKSLNRFQFSLPKSWTRYLVDEKHFQGFYAPLIVGALTFFLPCGFTITAQGLALISGNPWQGSLIMTAFVLGTMPMLLLIGLSAIKFLERKNWAGIFSKTAGILILFFALHNINSQLNILGLPSLSSLRQTAAVEGLAPMANGKQVLQMSATSSGYEPNYFKVIAGVPVRWEIIDKGTSGCTNAIISRSLFEGQIDLHPGQTSIKEFTPLKPGKYKFSCWMGMVSGVIEVIDQTGASIGAKIASGASGCGCSVNAKQ